MAIHRALIFRTLLEGSPHCCGVFALHNLQITKQSHSLVWYGHFMDC